MPRRNERRTPKARRRKYAVAQGVLIIERDPTFDEMAQDLVHRGLASRAILGSRPQRRVLSDDWEAAR